MAVSILDVPENRYLPPGTWVRKDGGYYFGEIEEKRTEWGVIKDCWLDQTLGIYDCLIAFHANTFSEPAPDIPYKLIYATMVLVEINEADVPNKTNEVLE